MKLTRFHLGAIALPCLLLGAAEHAFATTKNATIYFTIGSTPTTASTAYTAPFTLPAGQQVTVKAIAIASGYQNSLVFSGTTYTPTAAPTGPPYTDALSGTAGSP